MHPFKISSAIWWNLKGGFFAALIVLGSTAYCSTASGKGAVLVFPAVHSGQGIVSMTCTPGDTPTNVTIPSNFNQCSNGSTTLSVLATGTINWYSGPTSTLSLGTGPSFVTPTLTPGTHTFYAAATNTCAEGNRTPIQVNVIASPTSVAIGTVAPACPGTSVVMTASGANNYSWSTGAMTNTTVITPTAMTAYTVIGTNSMTGCSQTVTQVANVLALPTLSVSGGGTICTGQSTVLVVSGATTYTWSNGFTTNSIIATPSMSTTYTISGTATLTGCTGTISVYLLVDPCTGITESFTTPDKVFTYPNPSAGQMTLLMHSSAEYAVEITDGYGRVVLYKSISGKRGEVDLSGLNTGLYFLKVSGSNFISTSKIIKQ